jgi:hypothetical protein
MSFLTQKSTLESFIQANLVGTNVVFENQSQGNKVSEWVRVNILNPDSRQISLGNNPYFRYLGLLIFQIFIKPNVGSGRAMEIADQITALFRGKTISGMTFKPPVINPVGESGGWYQVNVSVNFSREEV